MISKSHKYLILIPLFIYQFGFTGTPIINDSSFEIGTPNTAWTETSTNFGSPICEIATCGNGTGTSTGPHSGNFWAWFGGTSAFEEATLSQTITIPNANLIFLSFYLDMPTCNDTDAKIEVSLSEPNNSATLIMYSTNQDDPNCGITGYRNIVIDITTFANSTRILEFHSINQGNGTTNFYIDDVNIIVNDIIYKNSFE